MPSRNWPPLSGPSPIGPASRRAWRRPPPPRPDGVPARSRPRPAPPAPCRACPARCASRPGRIPCRPRRPHRLRQPWTRRSAPWAEARSRNPPALPPERRGAPTPAIGCPVETHSSWHHLAIQIRSCAAARTGSGMPLRCTTPCPRMLPGAAAALPSQVLPRRCRLRQTRAYEFHREKNGLRAAVADRVVGTRTAVTE